MHGNHPARVQIKEGLGGVRWTCVDITVLGRVISAYGQQSEFGRQSASDFSEA